MIYEFRTYTLKPRSLAEVEKRYAEAYEHRKKYSPLAAFWHTEIGPLNEIIHVWGYKDLAKQWRKESIEEMEHADKLVERIIFLDGFPNMQVLDPLHIGQNVKEVLDCDLAAEMSARALYQEAATHCHGVRDYVTRDLFEKLMSDEEHHIDFLETQIDLVAKLGEVLDLIDEREATILRLRYGLGTTDGETMTLKEIGKVVVAYEPVWAIGTGHAATTEQAVAVHRAIRARIAAGSGTSVQQVNQVLQMRKQMEKMMKQMGRGKMPNLQSIVAQQRR